MLKKLAVSILLVFAIACGIGFSTTTAFAEDSTGNTIAVSNASTTQWASVSPYDLYPDGCAENVPFQIKEGDDVICTITFDMALVDYNSDSYTSLRMQKNSSMKIVPNESFSIKKIIVQGNNSSTVSTAIAIDAAQGTKVGLTDDEKTQLGNPYSMSVASFEINGEYVATGETPYAMKASMQFYLQTIHVVYERLSYSATVYPKSGSYESLDAGGFNVALTHVGYSDSSGLMVLNSTIIEITHAPGYVIDSVIITYTNPSNLSLAGTPAFTYDKTEEGVLTLTDFPISQTYRIQNNPDSSYFITSFTIKYNEHEHIPDEECVDGSDETHHFKQCECLYRINEEEHIFGEGEITLEPTHQGYGTIKKICTNAECGYVKEEQVAPNFADTEISLDKELRYNGSIQFAVYTVKYKGYEVGMSNYKVVSGVARGKEPGDYTFTIGPKDGSIFEGTKEFTFTIKKGSVAKPALDTTEFYFDNTVKTYTVENSEFYTVVDNSNQQTNPGSYKVKIALTNPDYYEWEDGTTDTLLYDFVINKGNYDMGEVVFNDLEVTYDGEEHSIIATNLPDGVTVEYENNGKTDAGEYVVTAKFTGEEAYVQYYNPIDNLTAVLIINKVVVIAPAADTTVFTYNGQEQTYSLAENELYTISNTNATNAGDYTITVALVDKNNYQWDEQSSDDLAYSFVINKAVYDMNGISFMGKTVTYNANEYKVEITGELPAGVSVSYVENKGTVAGTYNAVAKFTGDAGNYELIDDMTAVLIINKVVVTAPTADTTVFTYNGQEQTYSLAENELYTISNTNATNAGDYTITVALVDKNNYQWDSQSSGDLAFSFVINKATYDMSEVVFEDKAVVYTGNSFSIEATNLPTGVSVEYQNNGKTEIGEYTITAKFIGDVENYELIDDMTATLTIKKATFTFDTNTEDEIAEEIIINSSNGIDSDKELVVKLIESEKTDKDYKEFIDKNQKVAVAYDVKLLEEGVSVQPDGTLQFKILIPTKLVGKDFTILHIHNGNEASYIEYQIEGDYVVFESDKLSEFVFVYESNLWFWFIIILIAVMLLAGILVVIF